MRRIIILMGYCENFKKILIVLIATFTVLLMLYAVNARWSNCIIVASILSILGALIPATCKIYTSLGNYWHNTNKKTKMEFGLFIRSPQNKVSSSRWENSRYSGDCWVEGEVQTLLPGDIVLTNGIGGICILRNDKIVASRVIVHIHPC